MAEYCPLYCIVLHRTTPYSTVLHHTSPYHTILHRTSPYFILLHRTTLYFTVPLSSRVLKAERSTERGCQGAGVGEGPFCLGEPPVVPACSHQWPLHALSAAREDAAAWAGEEGSGSSSPTSPFHLFLLGRLLQPGDFVVEYFVLQWWPGSV